MLDLLGISVIGETLDAQKEKFVDTDAATEGLSKTLRASSSFMAPIPAFVRCKTGTEIEERKYISGFAYNKLIDTVPTFHDDSEPLACRYDSRDDEDPVGLCQNIARSVATESGSIGT